MLTSLEATMWQEFIISFIGFRIVFGFFDGLQLWAAQSVCLSFESDDRDELVKLYQMAKNSGFLAGPAFGGILYANFGLEKTFYIHAALLAFVSVINFFMLPDQLNKSEMAEAPNVD